MRTLFLIRHAKAEPGIGRRDHDRRLTGRGREDAAAVAQALADRNMIPDALIHSGAARARETAEIFAGVWGGSVPLDSDPRLYEATAGDILALVRGLADERGRIGLVGHNPGFGELASALAGSGPHDLLRRMASKFPTSAAAALDFSVEQWNEVHRRSAVLAAYLTPADLPAGAH